ncbi:hypothetical protein [Pseudophaeobacter sp.]
MVEILVTSLATLAIVLYLQARNSARIIRRNRDNARDPSHSLLIHPSDH